MEGRAGASVTGGGTRDVKEYEDLASLLGGDGQLREGYRVMIQERTMRKGGVYDVVGRGEEFKNAMEGLWDVKVVAGERMHFVQGKGGEVSGSIEVEDGMALSSEDSLKDVAEGYETLPSPSVGVDGDGGGGGGDGLLLHIGCKVRVPGWFCVDSDPTRPSVVDLVSDMGNLPTLPPSSVSAIYASHVLEHRHYGLFGPPGSEGVGNATDVLREWNRVMERGGHLMLAVPDLEALAGIFVDERLGEGQERLER